MGLIQIPHNLLVVQMLLLTDYQKSSFVLCTIVVKRKALKALAWICALVLLVYASSKRDIIYYTLNQQNHIIQTTMFIYFCLHIFNYFHPHLAICYHKFQGDFITKNLSILIMIMGSTTDQYDLLYMRSAVVLGGHCAWIQC